ncbi:hypothetical protein GCM10009613_44410 [Pseudonocardia kongjuensis]|uniref:Uncharacterized protein n=1 Tax=Pseudonocardia kongjuensis TaxID=102227 RepID=A0ABN1Y5V5_9PSEU
MMPTTSEMFETMTNWHQWNGADRRSRELEAEECHSLTDEYRRLRDERIVDPMHVLATTTTTTTTRDLVDALTTARWGLVREARLRGANWEEIACVVDQRIDRVRDTYASIAS